MYSSSQLTLCITQHGLFIGVASDLGGTCRIYNQFRLILELQIRIEISIIYNDSLSLSVIEEN